jgi:hypothetical protein
MPPPIAAEATTVSPSARITGGGGGFVAVVSFKEKDGNILDGNQLHRTFRKTPHPDKKRPASSSSSSSLTKGRENNMMDGSPSLFAPCVLLDGKVEEQQQCSTMKMAPVVTAFARSDDGPGHRGRSRNGEDDATATTAASSLSTGDETMATMTTEVGSVRSLPDSHSTGVLSMAASVSQTLLSRALNLRQHEDCQGVVSNPTDKDNQEDADEDSMQDVDIIDAAKAGSAHADSAAAAPGPGLDTSTTVSKDAWQAFCDKIEEVEPPQSVSRQNLEEFRTAREVREQSRRRLEGALGRALGGSLASEVSEVIDRVKTSRDEWFASNQALGFDAVRWAKDNHERRERLVRQVHDSFSHVEKACRGLVSQVMDEADALCGPPPPVKEGGSTGPGATNSKTREKDPNDSTLVDESEPPAVENQASGSKEGASGSVIEGGEEFQAEGAGIEHGDRATGEDDAKPTEPDWDLLLSFEPMRECTQSLMDTTAFLGQVDEHLSTTVTSLSSTLQECRDSLEAFAIDNYNMISDALSEQEDEIQAEMMRNLERRIDFEVAVREQAQQSQSYFRSLVQNIRTAFHGDVAGVSPPATDSSSSAKRTEPGS